MSNDVSFAQTRAEELVETFGHTRPSGGTVADIGYAEIIHGGNATSTPSKAFQNYYDSSAHRSIVLSEKYYSYGVGCYQANNGKIYWVVLFTK